jgi:predicted amidohydrolase
MLRSPRSTRKIHLFDVSVDRGPVDTDSARVTPGDRVIAAEVDGAVGLSICYHLRFPEHDPDRVGRLHEDRQSGANPHRREAWRRAPSR